MFTAVLLDHDSAGNLVDLFWNHIPENWEIVAHHMTINMGSVEEGPLSIYDLGKRVRLTVESVARDNKVMAVGVSTRVPSTNNIKHITLAVNRDAGGKPFDSNKLEKWVKLKRKFYLWGTIVEDEPQKIASNLKHRKTKTFYVLIFMPPDTESLFLGKLQNKQGRWNEIIVSGKIPYGWGKKTYDGNLTKEEVEEWLFFNYGEYIKTFSSKRKAIREWEESLGWGTLPFSPPEPKRKYRFKRRKGETETDFWIRVAKETGSEIIGLTPWIESIEKRKKKLKGQ